MGILESQIQNSASLFNDILKTLREKFFTDLKDDLETSDLVN